MIYKWKVGSQIPIKAQVAGEIIDELREAHQHKFTTSMVVEAARPIRSPLHKAFEWNDSVAAEKYRLEQAGCLIRAINIVTTDDGKPTDPIRAFVSVVQDEDTSPTYTNLSYAMRQPNLRAQVLEAAKRELQVWRDRYAHLKEFAEVVDAIDAVARRRAKAVPAKKRAA